MLPVRASHRDVPVGKSGGRAKANGGGEVEDDPLAHFSSDAECGGGRHGGRLWEGWESCVRVFTDHSSRPTISTLLAPHPHSTPPRHLRSTPSSSPRHSTRDPLVSPAVLHQGARNPAHHLVRHLCSLDPCADNSSSFSHDPLLGFIRPFACRENIRPPHDTHMDSDASGSAWRFAQCFGDKGEVDDITEGTQRPSTSLLGGIVSRRILTTDPHLVL